MTTRTLVFSIGAILWPALGLAIFPIPAIEWNPKTYSCVRAGDSLKIDGLLDEIAWSRAEWTDDFTDIEGKLGSTPHFRTRAKMLWDDRYFYVAAELEEPQLWATYRERDSVIYHDNHEYYELEINALGTEWDLLLLKPYRDGGPAIHGWDIAGLATAVTLSGTINEASDRDRGWTVEIAFPWKALAEAAHRPCPPEPGDRWRVNFSRVQWRLDVTPLGYFKTPDLEGNPLPENNWVWSPQGLIAMHYPEMWGFVEFRDVPGGPPVEILESDRARWQLCRLYYEQRRHREETDSWEESLEGVEVHLTPTGFEMRLEDAAGGIHHIDESGQLW